MIPPVHLYTSRREGFAGYARHGPGLGQIRVTRLASAPQITISVQSLHSPPLVIVPRGFMFILAVGSGHGHGSIASSKAQDLFALKRTMRSIRIPSRTGKPKFGYKLCDAASSERFGLLIASNISTFGIRSTPPPQLLTVTELG
jgi:hypothetical protein